MYARPSLLLMAVLLGALAPDASADITSHSCQAAQDGPVVAIVEHNACVGFVARGKRVDFDFMGSGRLIASADGRTVVMMQSYLHGGVDDDGNIVEHVGTREFKNPRVIFVYRDGKQVATHRIDDFIERPALVGRSISHVNWLQRAPATISGEKLVFTTSSYRTIEIASKSGKITRASDSADWRGCDVIASGKLNLKESKLEKAILVKTPSASREALPFAIAAKLERKTLTNKAWTTGCFDRRGNSLVLKRVL